MSVNVKKPNIDHPDVLEFYKLSQQNYPDLLEEIDMEGDL